MRPGGRSLRPTFGVPAREGHHAGDDGPREPYIRLCAQHGGGGRRQQACGPGSVAWQQRVRDASAVELAGREQVQGGQQHADPRRDRQRVQCEAVAVLQWAVDQCAGGLQQRRLSQRADCLGCGFGRRRRGQLDADPQHRKRRREPGERSRRGDVEGAAARRRRVPQVQEGAEGTGERRSGNEVGRRDPQSVVARGPPVPELVAAEYPEDAEGEPESVERRDALEGGLASDRERAVADGVRGAGGPTGHGGQGQQQFRGPGAYGVLHGRRPCGRVAGENRLDDDSG